MQTSNQRKSNQRFRAGLGVGLAFLIGVIAFVLAFQIVSYLRGGRVEPLLPPGERPVGELNMPILDPAVGTAASWSLDDHKGKIVVVNYFATWCGPCATETPGLVRLAHDYAPRGVVFVAVAFDRDDERQPGKPRQEVLRSFARSYELPYPILLPPEDSLLWKFQIPIPQTFLYDRSGRRAQALLGAIDERGLRATLDLLLKEPT